MIQSRVTPKRVWELSYVSGASLASLIKDFRSEIALSSMEILKGCGFSGPVKDIVSGFR